MVKNIFNYRHLFPMDPVVQKKTLRLYLILGNLGIYHWCPLPLQEVYDSGHLIGREL